MLLEIFAVYDAAAGAFMEPFALQTTEIALRAFREAVNTDGHQFCKFPADYTLFRVGFYDMTTGALRPESTPVSLGVAITMQRGHDA